MALTVNIAIRRDIATLDYYQTGSLPDAFATLPKEWSPDQIRAFQDYFDALMSGNLARKRMTKFMPADFKLIETRQPPLKDLYDEWLARIICYAFSVPASAFVSQVNRATSETLRMQATQEGLVPLKAWVKSALDYVIQVCMNEPGLEFVWVGDDAIDPLQQAQTLQILVSAGIKTREEARAELGLGGAPPAMAPAAGAAAPERSDALARLGKFNPYHDEQGRFTTADDAVESGGRGHGRPRPKRVEVASNDSAMSDASGDATSQAIAASEASEVAQIEPIEPPAAGPPETPGPGQGAEATPKETGPSSNPQAEAGSGGAESSPGNADSTDQDEEFEFTIPRFASERDLTIHFKKHGDDFGATTSSEYEDQAASFLTNQGNSDILQKARVDGNIVRFNPETDEFGVLTPDRHIETYLST
jgi:hypothetical protein